MNRRVVAAVAAVLLAAAGAWVILGYVRGADARAQAAEALTPVLVVSADIPGGTPVGDLGSSVTTEQVPTRLVAEGALSDLSSVEGLVTTTSLVPGEQVIAGRFGDPAAARADGSIPAPDGTEEVSITLERQRAVGGVLTPGDKVGVTGTFSTLNDGPDVSFALDGVLVTRVVVPADADGVYTITLALDETNAVAVAAAQAKGTVWLSLQAPGTAPGGGIGDSSAAVSTATGDAGTSTSDDTTTANSGGNS